MRRLQALIFDFDGLILDTELPEVLAWEAVFEQHGCRAPEDWWVDAIGRGADQIVRTPYDMLEELTGCPLNRAEVAEAQGLAFEKILDAGDALPGVRELIEAAAGAGVKLAVASSSRHDWVDGFLARLRLDSNFQSVRCADDVAAAKPFPDLYLAAVASLGVDSSACVALEDSPNGIAAAKAAGLTCVAVPNQLTRRLDLSAADARLPGLQGVSLEYFEGLLRDR